MKWLLTGALLLLCVAAPAQTVLTTPAASAGTILGRDIVDSTGASAGLLWDVVVDGDGNPLAGVISVGGFGGLGMRKVAVAWRLLRFVHGDGGTHVVMDLTLDEAATAPDMLGSNNGIVVLDRHTP